MKRGFYKISVILALITLATFGGVFAAYNYSTLEAQPESGYVSGVLTDKDLWFDTAISVLPNDLKAVLRDIKNAFNGEKNAFSECYVKSDRAEYGYVGSMDKAFASYAVNGTFILDFREYDAESETGVLYVYVDEITAADLNARKSGSDFNPLYRVTLIADAAKSFKITECLKGHSLVTDYEGGEYGVHAFAFGTAPRTVSGVTTTATYRGKWTHSITG